MDEADKMTRLTMGRLATEFHESLTPVQRLAVIKALESGDVRVPELSISMKNALFVLLAANDSKVLQNYFKEEL